MTETTGLSKDYGLKDQIQRAAVSIMANIAEGFDSLSDLEFIRFLPYSRSSASELQSHLYVLLDKGYLKENEFQALYTKTIDAKSLIGGLIRYLKSKKH